MVEVAAVNPNYIIQVSDYMPLNKPRRKRVMDIDGSILPIILVDSGEDP